MWLCSIFIYGISTSVTISSGNKQANSLTLKPWYQSPMKIGSSWKAENASKNFCGYFFLLGVSFFSEPCQGFWCTNRRSMPVAHIEPRYPSLVRMYPCLYPRCSSSVRCFRTNVWSIDSTKQSSKPLIECRQPYRVDTERGLYELVSSYRSWTVNMVKYKHRQYESTVDNRTAWGLPW